MSTNSHQIGRREFLVVSTAAVATASVVPELLANELAIAPKRIAVGFVSFEDNTSVIPASSVRSADRRFVDDGANVGIYGSRSVKADPRDRRAVDLVAHFSVTEGNEQKTIPFYAWGGSRHTVCEGKSGTFTMPVNHENNLVFSLGTERGVPSGAPARRRDLFSVPTHRASNEVTLSATNDPNALKLARGFYVFAPLFEKDSEPRWSNHQLRQIDGRWTLVDTNGKHAEFEHFVLRIDYALAS
jgi:hypothetical protein